MKKITYALLLVFGMSVLFSSCGKEGNGGFDSIVGTWEIVSMEGWGESESVEETYLCFKKDGTFIDFGYDDVSDRNYVSYGRWSLAGNSLSFLYDEAFDSDFINFPVGVTVLEIKTNTMNWSILGCTIKLKRVSDSVIKKYL